MGEDFKSFYQGVLEKRLSDLLPPPLRDSYEPVTCLMQGAGSEAYLVKRRPDGLQAVLRVVEPGAGGSALMEKQILDRLDHPAIPKALDALCQDGREYLVREYMQGRTLKAYVDAHGPLQERELLAIALALCDILHYIHTRRPPIIHRDIKPENIVIDQAGRVKLIDFGIARAYRDQAPSDTVAIGTRPYMAPEQFGGAQTDARADLFSLGVVMIFMATKDHDRTNLRHRFPYKRLAPIAQKLVMIDPAARYQSAGALKRALVRAQRRTLRRALSGAGAAVLAAAMLMGAHTLGDGAGYARGYAQGYRAGEAAGLVRGEKQGFDQGYEQRLDQLIQARAQGLDDHAPRIFAGAPGYGNSGGNLINGGLAAEADGAVYYATSTQIYKAQPDGRTALVCNHAGKALNCHDGYLYHVGKYGYVYRATLDGKACVPIVKVAVDDLLMDEKHLYMTNSEDERKLYRAGLDGSGLQKISDLTQMYYLNISGGYLYFAHGEGEDRNLVRLNVNDPGAQPQLLDKADVNWLNVVGDYAFYDAYNTEPQMRYISGRVMRLSVDGTDRALLVSDELSYLNVTPYGMFASDGVDGGTLHKRSLDGRADRRLTDARVGNLCVAGGWVFYQNKDDGGALYRVRVDGTDDQKVE